VFRSPFVQSPIPGRPATLLVLTTVVQIFEKNFRYHRTFCRRLPTDVCAGNLAPISANGSSRAIDLITFNEGRRKMTEFEVMVRPIKALQGARGGNGEPDRPAKLGQFEGGGRGPRTDYWRFFDTPRGPFARLRGRGPCGKESAPLCQGPFFGRFS